MQIFLLCLTLTDADHLPIGLRGLAAAHSHLSALNGITPAVQTTGTVSPVHVTVAVNRAQHRGAMIPLFPIPMWIHA